MPLYESTFIARHDMSSQQVEALAGTLTEVVKENGGEVAKTEFWGLKTLAYRIKKNRKGHYVHFNLNASSASVQELERNMRLNEDVLRYLTVRVDELDPEPSVMMQARAARDDRARRGGGPPRSRSEERAKPAGEEPPKAKDAEPAETKDAEPAKAKDAQPAKAKDAKPAKAKDAEPAKAKDAKPAKAKDAEPAETKDAEPAETKDAKPVKPESKTGDDDAKEAPEKAGKDSGDDE